MPRTTRSHSNNRPYAAPLSKEVKYYLETRGFKLEPWQKPLWRTREPTRLPGAVFDPSAVDNVLKSFSYLRHTQGKWAGKPLKPEAWEVAYLIAPVFGWLRKNGDGRYVRIYRQSWTEVPRKNGKTTMSAAFALHLAFGDGERGAQVFAAAAAKDQAKLAYDPARIMVGASPAFRAAGVVPLKKEIMREIDGSYFTVVSSVGDLIQGTNPHGYIVDEMHVHKSLDVIEALEYGTGAREQPLGFVLTTADKGGRHTPYAQRREMVEKLCKGIIDDPTQYAVIFGAPQSADPFKESTWKRANPNYGISPSREYMEMAAQKAKNSPVDEAAFRRFNLNQRTKQETKFISMRAWDKNRDRKLANWKKLVGRECYAGIDLASVSDLTAVCYLFPEPIGRYIAMWRFFTPEDNIEALDRRTAGMASVWASEGYLQTTPGNVQDYDYIRAQLKRDAENYQIMTVGYDPWNSSQFATDLQNDGLMLTKVRQGFASMNEPLKEIQRLVLRGAKGAPGIAHDNPVMDWCMDNLAVATDPAGNVKPDKAKSGEKIDGVSALVNAMFEAMNEARISAYEQRNADDEKEMLIVV